MRYTDNDINDINKLINSFRTETRVLSEVIGKFGNGDITLTDLTTCFRCSDSTQSYYKQYQKTVQKLNIFLDFLASTTEQSWENYYAQKTD